MRLNFTIRDCTDSNRPKVHDYVAMLRRILTQYPHAEFVFQFAPDGILSFYGEFLPDIKEIAAEMCWCVIDCDTDGYIQTGTACHTMIGVEITCRQTRTGWWADRIEEKFLVGDVPDHFYPLVPDFRPPIRTFGFHSYYLHDYSPVSRQDFAHTPDEFQRRVTNLVSKFKSGEASDCVAYFMAIAFARTPELTSRRADFTLMIIPASTNERHELRFRNFSVEFTGLLRIANGYDAITVTRDREEYKGQHYKNKTDNLHFDEAAIRGRHILLFDDLLTTGAGLSQVSRKLLACGALSVTGLFLAKTLPPEDEYDFLPVEEAPATE